MPSLTNYRGIQVLAPDPVGDGGLAIQNDLKSLVDWSPKSLWDESTDPDSDNDETEDFFPGSLWLRTDVTPPRLFVCKSNSTGDAEWILIALQTASVVTETSAHTIVLTDAVVLADATSGAFAVTLPTAVDNTGRQFTIKRINGGSNNVTLAAAGGQTIDGASTYVLDVQYKFATVISNGSNWFLV
jgi:hypothetical protein